MEKINENLILKECEKCGKLKEVFLVQFTIKSILPKVSSREPLIFGRYKICEDCFHKLNSAVFEFFTEIPSPAKPNLGCATTKELLEEITARIEVSGELDYKTIDCDK